MKIISKSDRHKIYNYFTDVSDKLSMLILINYTKVISSTHPLYNNIYITTTHHTSVCSSKSYSLSYFIADIPHIVLRVIFTDTFNNLIVKYIRVIMTDNIFS